MAKRKTKEQLELEAARALIAAAEEKQHQAEMEAAQKQREAEAAEEAAKRQKFETKLESDETFQLSNKAVRQLLEDNELGGYDELHSDGDKLNCNLYNYLKTGNVSRLVNGQQPIYVTDRTLVAIRDNLINDAGPYINRITANLQRWRNEPPIGFIVAKPKKSKNKCAVFALINGDETNGPDNSFVDEASGLQLPTFSFECFVRFYKDRAAALNAFVKGNVAVVDYTVDERINISAADYKRFELQDKTKHPRPPQPGFRQVGRTWHRSATVLLYDSATEMSILIGQDEGTYFGVELPRRCESIKDAFEALIPKEAKGKRYVRQGEWFMVPVAETVVPKLTECALMIGDAGEYNSANNTYLPVEDEESNRHWLETDDGRVSMTGQLYAFNPSLSHDEHQTISMTGWTTFYKNTAKRSFSVEGVD